MKARFLTPVILFVFAFQPTNVLAQESEESTTVKEMEKLEWMIGKWHWMGEWFPSDPSERTSFKTLWECGWLFDKTIIECRSHIGENLDKLQSIEYFSYDPLYKNYVISFYGGEDNRSHPAIGTIVQHEERWVDRATTITAEYKTLDQLVFIPKGDTIEVEQYRSQNGESLKKVQEAVVNRVD